MGPRDPANKERRRRGQSRGGKNKPSRELQDIKARLLALADGVLEGRRNRASAAIAGQLLNTYIRAVSVELKAKEQQDLIERIEALERSREEGDRSWRGA